MIVNVTVTRIVLVRLPSFSHLGAGGTSCHLWLAKLLLVRGKCDRERRQGHKPVSLERAPSLPVESRTPCSALLNSMRPVADTGVRGSQLTTLRTLFFIQVVLGEKILCWGIWRKGTSRNELANLKALLDQNCGSTLGVLVSGLKRNTGFNGPHEAISKTMFTAQCCCGLTKTGLNLLKSVHPHAQPDVSDMFSFPVFVSLRCLFFGLSVDIHPKQSFCNFSFAAGFV